MRYLTLDKALDKFDDEEKNELYNFFSKLKLNKKNIDIVKSYIGNISSITAMKILKYNIYYTKRNRKNQLDKVI